MNNLLTKSFELVIIRPPREGSSSPPNDLGMEAFFSQVADIEKQFDKINTQLYKLQAANEKSQHVTKASQMKDIKEQMEKDIDEARMIALKVKTSLEELDKDNLSNRKKSGCEKGTGVDRSRLVMTMTLKKKFKERMDEFQALRLRIQDEYREVVERRVFTVTGSRPDEETIEHLIETGNSEQIFAKAIQGQGRGQIADALAEIQERCDAVREIEQKLIDLQQMFVDLSVLVEAQGDMINDIEAQVSTSVDHIQSATVTLQKAKKLQRNTRKYTCLAIFILLMVIIVVLAPILLELKPWSKQGA